MRWQNRRQRAQIKVSSFYLAAQVCVNGGQISSVCEENNNFISVTVKETSDFGNCAFLDLNPANWIAILYVITDSFNEHIYVVHPFTAPYCGGIPKEIRQLKASDKI